MRRRPLLGLLAVAGLLGIVTTLNAWHGTDAAAGQRGFESGGVGLTRAEWEAIHGGGEVCQDSVTYGGRYVVQFAGDAVSFIELGWEERAGGGVATDAARAEVEALLPDDADRVETFFAPPTLGGPVGLTVERYQSDGLPDRYPSTQSSPSGGIAVIYQETGRVEPVVTRASIAVGREVGEP